jgi:hypothetical protein
MAFIVKSVKSQFQIHDISKTPGITLSLCQNAMHGVLQIRNRTECLGRVFFRSKTMLSSMLFNYDDYIGQIPSNGCLQDHCIQYQNATYASHASFCEAKQSGVP